MSVAEQRCRRRCKRGRVPLDIVVAAAGLRSLGDASSYASSVERMRALVLESVEGAEYEAARRFLLEAEHLLRTFGPKREPRTLLGGRWWGLDPAAPYIGWKPGAANPLANRVALRLALSGRGLARAGGVEGARAPARRRLRALPGKRIKADARLRACVARPSGGPRIRPPGCASGFDAKPTRRGLPGSSVRKRPPSASAARA